MSEHQEIERKLKEIERLVGEVKRLIDADEPAPRRPRLVLHRECVATLPDWP